MSRTVFAETYSTPCADEASTILDMLRRHKAETVRGWSEDYEFLWLTKDQGPRAAAWINFRAAYDKGLLNDWMTNH